VVLLSHPKSSNKRPVYARSGWEIPQENLEQFHIDKLEAGLMKIRSQQLREWHPNAKIRSLSSYPYNCVGLIFASRRAVISIEEIYDILREDGFRAISLAEIMAGDVVLYKYQNEPSHVAVITYVSTAPRSITVLSRWGLDGEFIHFMEDVPAIYGIAAEFYTERKS
jgi:hypothetical protein